MSSVEIRVAHGAPFTMSSPPIFSVILEEFSIYDWVSDDASSEALAQ